MLTTYLLSFKMAMPMQKRPPAREVVQLSRKALLSLLTPLIIVGGIWTGVFTPTEAGVVASTYALVLVLFVYKDIGWKEVLGVFYETIKFNAIILFIISIAVLYGWLLVRLQIPHTLAGLVMGISTNTTVLLIIIAGFFLVVGCFMSVIESVLIFTPVMVPMIKLMGVDPLFFGVLMTISLSVGVITPPFGNVIYVLVGITHRNFEFVVRAIIPFLIPILLVILLLVFFPGLITFLPGFITN